jgi:hypothetical protein
VWVLRTFRNADDELIAEHPVSPGEVARILDPGDERHAGYESLPIGPDRSDWLAERAGGKVDFERFAYFLDYDGEPGERTAGGPAAETRRSAR